MRYNGSVGFAVTKETAPSIFTELIKEQIYSGDVIKNYQQIRNQSQINAKITILNQISIIADKYAYENISNIRYATFANQKWSVISVDIQPPRLILTLGDVYNE